MVCHGKVTGDKNARLTVCRGAGRKKRRFRAASVLDRDQRRQLFFVEENFVK
jgi:hypothetical protein